MSIELNGTTGITTPGLTNTGTETIVNLTTTGNTILGNASTDTLNVGNGDLIKDASGNLAVTGGATIQGLTVGKGAGAVASNTAVGVSALAANTTGVRCSVFGYNAGAANTSGADTVAFGSNALAHNTTGVQNSAFGTNALVTNISGDSNTAIGSFALESSTGNYNTAVGRDALLSNTTASNNTAVGYQALAANTTGVNNTIIGYSAGSSNLSGANNTFIGQSAGATSTGGSNTFVGYSAGNAVTTGTGNAFFGLNPALGGAGYVVTTGSKNTIIGGYSGNQGGLDIRTASNYIVLSDGDGNPRVFVDSSGNLTVGNTTDGSKVNQGISSVTSGTSGRFTWYSSGGTSQYVTGDIIGGANFATLAADSGTSGWKIRTYSASYAYRFEFNANGAAYNTTGTWGTISDARIKQDIVPANSAWEDIKALAFKKYRLKSEVAFEYSDENTQGYIAPTLFGLVAQDVQKTSPGLVEVTCSSEVEDGKLLAIKTSVILMKSAKALQEAMERIETLEAKVQQLEAK